MTAKVTPFKWKERKRQSLRTATVLANLAKDSDLRPYLIIDVGPDGKALPFKMVGVHIEGAVGSMNYVNAACSYCEKTIRRGRFRLEIFVLRKGIAAIAYQFGERFCSEKCGTEFGKEFLKHGLKHQRIKVKPDKCLLNIELNAIQNHRLN